MPSNLFEVFPGDPASLATAGLPKPSLDAGNTPHRHHLSNASRTRSGRFMKTDSASWSRRAVRHAGILLAALCILIVSDVRAGDHWLSRVTIKRPNQPEISMLASQAAAYGLDAASLTDATVIFDVTISLDTNPLGDDQYPENPGAHLPQNEYEARLEEFARAVYQSSNGAIRIGKVTIFRSRPGEKRVDTADVLWDDKCNDRKKGPRATPSGRGNRGKVWFCTTWAGAADMKTPKGSGYTLAHEWGHFAYGLKDEYAQEQCLPALANANRCPRSTPRATDVAANPSIMTNQWKAAKTGGDRDYLEFSTRNIPPYTSSSTGMNAQKRVFGESGWETLTRDPATDPRYLDDPIPPRTRYLALTAPAAPNWLVHDNESPALDAFDIIWAGPQVNELSIDTSGSMAGSPLSNAKTGANLLIDTFGAGAAIGISSFNTFVTRNFAFTDIPDPDTGVRTAAKAAVNGLTSTGFTSLYDGLMVSLNDVQAFSGDRPSVVFVLSDGEDNDSVATEESVIAAYKAARVPIVAFAYGSFAPTGTLFRLSDETGGAFYQSPTSLSDIQAALIAADARFSSNVVVSSSKVAVAGNSTTTRTVSLDSTLASVRINLSYAGSPADFELRLLRPNGALSSATFTCEGNASCTAAVDQAFFNASGYGDYQVQMVNKTSVQKDVTVLISAAPSGAETYEISAGFEVKNLTYPADLALTATVTKGPAIAGLDVVATVTPPTGNPFTVTLLDDGEGLDRVADDGTYSASIPYKVNGIFSAVVTASNPAGTANTTFEGISISLAEDGTAVIPEPTPVPEHFSRVESSSASVTGVQSDDHYDLPSGPCTTIFDNNVDTAGRVDFAGDADCFRLVPSSTSRPVVVRVTSLTSGMDPVLTVYNHTGGVQLAQASLATTEAPDSGAIVTIPAASLDASGIVLLVKHLSTAAASGGYAVSAGAKILSDESYVLTITGAGAGEGVVTGNGIDCTVDGGSTSGTCTAIYAPGTAVSLTATPAEEAGSATLSGGGCSGESTCTVVMTLARTVTATFESASELILNGGFELAPATGNEAPGWGVFPSPESGHLLIAKNILPTHSGTVCALLGGTDLTQYDTLSQYVAIPEDVTAANLTFWTRVVTREPAGQGAYDFLWVVLHDSDGNELARPAQLSNENVGTTYFQTGPLDLAAYAGTTVRLSFVAYTDNVFETRFLIDDVSLIAVRPDTGPRPRITAPAAGALLSGTVSVSATAIPNGSAVTRLAIEIDGVQKALTTTAANLTYSWNTMGVGNGLHSIAARAKDAAGNEVLSPVVTVTTSNLLAPQHVVAKATSAANVSVTWDALNTAASYQIFRRANGGPYELAGTSRSNSFVHSGLPANSAFIYQVRAVDASGNAGPPSAGDLATTVRFADDPLLTGVTTVKAIHLTQLRTAVNAVRTAAGLATVTFTDSVAKGDLMRAIYVTELRASLDAARAAAGLPAMTWGSSVTAGTAIKATHLEKLREGVE
jgi:calcium-activated chloride channel regulator 4